MSPGSQKFASLFLEKTFDRALVFVAHSGHFHVHMDAEHWQAIAQHGKKPFEAFVRNNKIHIV